MDRITENLLQDFVKEFGMVSPRCISFKIKVLSKDEGDKLEIGAKGMEYIEKFVKKYQDTWGKKIY